MLTEELKKQTRFIDLALSAGQKRKKARTGFVHDEETIPLYENFCFAFALFRQKTAESITEGKELIDRLLAFQSPDGNFPTYLHDFPRCFDFQMGLKVAPILIYLLRLFSPVLGELKPKVEEALRKTLLKPPEKPFWLNRYRACLSEPLLPFDTTSLSPLEWTDWLITAQLAGETHFSIPYDPDLQLFSSYSQFDIQEGREPRPNPIEWLLADGQFSPRLLRDHPHQLLCAPLFPISFTRQPISDASFRLFWKGALLHSLYAPSLTFDLSEEPAKPNLFEVQLFCNLSPETTFLINGQKATTFQLGDRITLHTPTKTLHFSFVLTKGEGDFCGHIFPANRPSQIACKGENQYTAYDWQIALRTLRRTTPTQIQIREIDN